MEIRRISTSDSSPVDVDDVKLDLRIDGTDDEETIERMIRTAARLIEDRSGFVILQGEFEVLVDCFAPVEIMRGPFREMVSIKAMTGRNDWTDVDAADFRVIEKTRSFELSPFLPWTAPELYTPRAGVAIRFKAGFDNTDSAQSGDDHPLDDKLQGILIALVGHYYENRELFMADKLTEIESTAGGLLNSIRQFW